MLKKNQYLCYEGCYGPNACSHCMKAWHRYYPFCDAPLSRLARRRLALLHKSCRKDHFYERTEALCGNVFAPEQELYTSISFSLFVSFFENLVDATIFRGIYMYIYMSGFDKGYLQKFQVRFNNLTLEVNKKQLKVAS